MRFACLHRKTAGGCKFAPRSCTSLALAEKVLFIQLRCIGNPAFDYRSLSVAGRLQLVGDIWNSIADEANIAADKHFLKGATRAIIRCACSRTWA